MCVCACSHFSGSIRKTCQTQASDKKKMVLYVFGVRGAAYVKVGYTASCPWSRVRDGFWRNVHPKGCCNRLG